MSNIVAIDPAHSPWGASSYSRWSAIHGGCPGSVKMSEGCANLESEYAKEGTHAHTVASQELERILFNRQPKEGYLAATEEMREATDVYVDFVMQMVNESNAEVDKGHVMIEHRFDLKSVYPGLFGTADAVVYDPGHKKLTVIDYKHGAGIAVEVEDNLQLQYYGLGALLSTNFPCDDVELVVVQPRCDHQDGVIRKWQFKSVEILDFAADLEADAQATMEEDAPLKPGKHCRFCPAAATKCPAIKAKAQELAKLEFGAGLSYDPVKLDQALRFIPAMEAWIKKVREFAYGEAVHGRTPEGWKMVAKRATRKWKVDDDTVIKFMAEATKKPVAEFYETPSIKSPAKMEKLVSKQIGQGLREMIESVSSGYNLVTADDPRPAAKLDPKSEFTAITEGEE